MYSVTIALQPAGAITCRIIPGSIVDIASYPFVPPTAMSGYLKRLCVLAAGHDLPTSSVQEKKKLSPFYTLPAHMVTTGALPSGLQGIHKTHRKGPAQMDHFGFSKINREKMEKKENIQLHTWEYFFCEALTGYVVSKDKDALTWLSQIEGWGCKIGKEGYAFVSSVSAPVPLEEVHTRACPSTLFCPDDVALEDIYQPCTMYNIHRYAWDKEGCQPPPEAPTPTSIEGYAPLAAAIPHQDTMLHMDYLHDGKKLHIPTSWIKRLEGES